MNSVLWFAFALFASVVCEDSEDIEWCIDSKYHKKRPSEENDLHKQCQPWKSYSCCSEDTSVRAHQTFNHYNFNLNHCPNQPMSEKCKRHFIQDLCFYECEPYVKPWVVQVNRSFASQRIYSVPLCARDCEEWWSDCRHDYTCVLNWSRDFKWINRTNRCPPESQCRPIGEVFENAQQFCQMIWDHSWEYTTEDKPCMKIWFDPTKGNPNKETAKYYNNLRREPNGSDFKLLSIEVTLFVLLIHRFYS